MDTEAVLEFIKNIKQIEKNYNKSGGSFTNEMLKEFVKEACENFCQVDLQVSDANGGQVPQTIKLQLKDFVEFLSMVDMALQPDFPVNKSANLLNKIKQICLKYGINWTGRG